MHKYSFIFCYRDREEHAKITLPRIQKIMEGKDFETIIVEQNDSRKFRRGNLLNEGARYASGDIIILHDIDHVPADGTTYYEEEVDCYLPLKRVEFVLNDFTPRPDEEIPSGYRHYKKSVDDNFFGSVEVFTKEAFFRINGFCPLYKGWGFEDADLRERVAANKLRFKRSDSNLFYALEHKDNCPQREDRDFQNNMQMVSQWKTFAHLGVKNQPSKTEEVEPKFGATRWLKSTDFDITHGSKIVTSAIPMEDF